MAPRAEVPEGGFTAVRVYSTRTQKLEEGT